MPSDASGEPVACTRVLPSQCTNGRCGILHDATFAGRKKGVLGIKICSHSKYPNVIFRGGKVIHYCRSASRIDNAQLEFSCKQKITFPVYYVDQSHARDLAAYLLGTYFIRDTPPGEPFVELVRVDH